MPEKLPPSIRQLVLERDGGQCRKCGRAEHLHAHHIIGRADGGLDNLANLIALCVACHREWHMVEATYHLPFADWLQVPTYGVLFAVYQCLPDELRHSADTVWSARRHG